MAKKKKSGLKKIFSKSKNKNCCSVEIEEVKSPENNNYNEKTDNNVK